METVTHLTGGHATDSASENLGDQTTSSFTPSNGTVIIVAIGSNHPSGTPNTPTITGLGMTWTLIDTVTGGAGSHLRMTFYRGVANGNSGSLTISHGGQLEQNIYWEVMQLNYVASTGTNGADAIVQSARGSGASQTSFLATLGAFSNSHNGVLGAVYQNTSQNVTPGSGFSEVNEVSGAHSIEAEFKATNDTSVDWSVSTTADYVALAIELKQGILGGGILAIL